MARRISCEQISPLLSAYLDGELSRAERESVEWHLSECEACRNELRELEEVKQFALQLDEVQPPISLRERIMARVEKEKECEPFRPLLGAYLDGEIAETEREELEQHIAMCEYCQAELEAEKKVRQVLQTLPEVEPPLYLRARIYASIERKPLILRRFALGFATMAAAASLVFFTLPVHNTTPSQQAPVVAQQSIPSQKVAVKPSQQKTTISQEKARKTVVPWETSQRKEKPVITIQSPMGKEEEATIDTTNPVISSQPAEAPSVVEVKSEPKEAGQSTTPEEVAPVSPTLTAPVKVAVKPEHSLSDVLKDITSSVDKSSLPSRIGEPLDKSIVVGVVKVEF